MSLRRRERYCFKPLEGKGNCAASNNMLVHWALMGGLLHLVQQGGDRAEPQPAQVPPHCTKCNSPPSTPSVPIAVLPYNGPLLCGFNVLVEGLMDFDSTRWAMALGSTCGHISGQIYVNTFEKSNRSNRHFFKHSQTRSLLCHSPFV